MVAQVERLGPLASTLVTLVISPCTSLSCRTFELAFACLVGKAQRSVLAVMGHTSLRDLDFGGSCSCSAKAFSMAFLTLLALLLFERSRRTWWWGLVAFQGWHWCQVLKHLSRVFQFANCCVQRLSRQDYWTACPWSCGTLEPTCVCHSPPAVARRSWQSLWVVL